MIRAYIDGRWRDMVRRVAGTREVRAAYRGARLVWEAVSSCFGAGFWRSDMPWKSSDPWKNNDI